MNVRCLTTSGSVSIGVMLAALLLPGPRPAVAGATLEPWQEDQARPRRERQRGQRQLDQEPPDRPKERLRERRHRPGPDKRGPARREGRRRGPPRGPGGEFPEGRRPGPVDPELIGRAMEVIRAKLPEFHERLERFRHQNPKRFEDTMRNVLPVFQEYIDLRDSNPELAETIIEEFRIEERLKQLSRQYGAAQENPEERAEIERELERLVHEQLELRFRRQEFRLEGFERRLHRQQERLEQQRVKLHEEMERRDELAAQRLEEIKAGKLGDQLRRRGPRRLGPDDELDRRPPRGPRADRRSSRRYRGSFAPQRPTWCWEEARILQTDDPDAGPIVKQ